MVKSCDKYGETYQEVYVIKFRLQRLDAKVQARTMRQQHICQTAAADLLGKLEALWVLAPVHVGPLWV